MMNIYWFNPENDIALGLDARGAFTPPRAAVAMRQAGALLPLLWAGDDDRVLTVDVTDSRDERVVSAVGRGGALRPWGWSRYAAEVFSRHGASGEQLPVNGLLDQWRALSHRATATALMKTIGVSEDRIPVVAESVEEAIMAVGRFGGNAMVKLPWSCSGRGVMPVGKDFDRVALERLIGGMIRRQGSVTVEPRLDCVRNFAALFYMEGGRAEYRGLSVFHTDAAGNYAGNIVAPPSVLIEKLGIDISGTVSSLRQGLEQCIKDYEGWVGVDMMEHRLEDGSMAIAPCIEVNLRMTMGVAALLASESTLFRNMGCPSGSALLASESTLFRNMGCPSGSALLHVAPPGTVLPADALTFSALRPEPGVPLRYPVITLTAL